MKRFLILLALVIVAILVGALSFTTSPVINDGNNATTTENLRCEWTASGDTTQTNITWYRDGTIFLNVTNATSPNTISNSNTTRGENWNCTVIITNGTSTINQSDDIVIVNADPNTPVVRNETGANIGNQTNLNEDDARTYNVTATDPDGDSVSYSTLNLPTNATFSSSTGIMQWTPSAGQTGNTTVTFLALDNQTPERGSSAIDVTFTVLEVNDNPQFNPVLSDQTATEGQPFEYNITATDEENDFPINFTMSTNLGSLIINTTSNTTATITFVGGSPTFADRGNHTVNVTITDSRNGTNTSSFNLEVIPVNQLPNLSQIANASGTQGVFFEIFLNATDLDVNDTLTFSVAAVSCSLSNPWNVNKITQVTQGNQTFANATINQTLTNDHVVCPQVNISVSDSKESDWQLVTFNISNVNDAPTLNQISNDPQNTNNSNITNQTAYSNTIFRYQVNATDPDELVAGGEVLTYSDNTTLFNINSTTGLIEFTPTDPDIGNYTILITVTDDDGLNDTETMILSIVNNSAPIIQNPGTVTCFEDTLCTVFINASDADGDAITFSSNDTIFNITTFNTTTGIVNTTYVQNQVGNYTINVTATDTFGATDSTSFTFIVNNSNDAPVLDPVTFPSPIVVTHAVTVQVTADDDDILLFGGNHQLNYSRTFISGSTIFNITTSFNNATNESTGTISFVPASNETGNYSVNISVQDPAGATDWQVVNFTVLADTDPPNISQIRPYGTPVSNTTVFALANTSNFPNNTTNITINENTSVLFNHTTTDDTTPLANLTFTWQYDGTNVSTNYSYNRSFDFFSSGSHTLILLVDDDRLETSNFTWNIQVNNVNRNPVLHNDLENVTISSTETFSNYLYLRSDLKYLDPDDDVDGSLLIDGNETNLLSFAVSSCSVADITITDQDVKFTPTDVGTCLISFNATDPQGASTNSNTILVNVTDVPNGTTTTQTVTVTTSSGGGGGGGGAIVIPRDREVEIPKPLNLIAPEEITIYRNRSVTIPILLENTWNDTITGITIGANANYSEVDVSFDEQFIPSLETGERRRVQMTVTGYRLGENFEVIVNASVNEPEFKDSALILFNSIEQAFRGEEVKIMVTFARDLLTKNEECQELGELLNEAERAANRGNDNQASKLLDTVINGCRYLMSETRQATRERPATINLNFFERFNFFYIGTGMLLIAFLAAIGIIEYRIRKEDKNEKS